jgi:hypothetical protein
MTLHPNRTNRRTFKLRRPDGIVIERSCIEGGALADQPGYSLAEPDAVSVREQVEALGNIEIRRRLLARGDVSATTEGDRVAALTALAEAGEVILP